MPCPTLISPACKVAAKVGGAAAGEAGKRAVDSGLDSLAKQMQQAVAWLVRNTVSWWVHVDSVDLAAQPSIAQMRGWFLPICVAVTIGGMIAAGARMVISRKANPLIDVGGGLLVIAAAGALGVSVPNLLLKAGDAWSDWVLTKAAGRQFGARMADLLSMTGATSTGLIVVLGVIALLLATVQAILMLFRETAVLILAGVLPLAAAGALSPGTRGWIKRVGGWLLALIFYKPAAAAVYAVAFALLGRGHGLRAILMGFCMLALSVIALPVLIKFFTFATGAVGSSGGGGILGTAVGAVVAVGALRGSGGAGGGSAVEQAGYTAGRLPPPGASGSGGGAPTSAPGGGSPPTGQPAAGTSGAASGRPAPGAAGSGSPAAQAGAASTGTAGAGAGAAGAGRASTAAAGAGAAAGPVGAAVAGAAQTAKKATGAAGDAMGTEDGGAS